MKNELKIESRVWIQGKTATYLGEGRVELLEHILETGSLNEASKRMQMSYKKALKLVDHMNSQTSSKLVESSSGGRGGGGTVVTEAGIKAIELYKEIQSSCRVFLEEKFKELAIDE